MRGLGGLHFFGLRLPRFAQEFAAHGQRDRGLLACERCFGHGDQFLPLVGLANLDQQPHDRKPDFIGLGLQFTGVQQGVDRLLPQPDHFRIAPPLPLVAFRLDLQTVGQDAVQLSLPKELPVVLVVGGNRLVQGLLGLGDVADEDLHVGVLLAHLPEQRALLPFEELEQLPASSTRP